MSKVDEIVKNTYPKYSSSFDLCEKAYIYMTRKNGRYDAFNKTDLMNLVEEITNILSNIISNDVYEMDELIDALIDFLLSYCANEKDSKCGGRAEYNSKKRMEKINKLIDLRDKFTKKVDIRCSSDEIIDSTYILRLNEFMKLYNGKSYMISKYKTEDELIEDLDSLVYSPSLLRKSYMCFVLSKIKVEIEKFDMSVDLNYLINRIDFYIGANRYTRLPIIDRVSFDKIEMMIKIDEYEKKHIKA